MSAAFPPGAARERRALQAVVAVASLVPIVAGGSGVLLGPRFVGGPADAPDLTSHFAYLSGLLLGLGLLFLAIVPTVERRGALVRPVAAIIVCGGLARLLTLWLAGPPSWPHRLALVMELVVTPILALWQARVARRCGV